MDSKRDHSDVVITVLAKMPVIEMTTEQFYLEFDKSVRAALKINSLDLLKTIKAI